MSNILPQAKDLETAMQLLYLNITEPRFDNEEFLIGINQLKAVLPNLEKMPQLKLQKLIRETLYGGHDRVPTINSELVEKANISDFEKASRRLFGNVAGATVYVVGNVDAETLKPLVTKYIASLPGGKKGSKFIDRKEDIVKGNVTKNETMAMETPKSTVLQVYTANTPYSIKNEVLLDIAKLYLDMVYVETLRESEGGTYGAGVATVCGREPKDVAILQVVFETNPESAEKLSKLAIEGVRKIITEGIPADKFDMIIKNVQKNIPQDRISNSYWGSTLQKYVEFGDKYDSEYEQAVNTATPEAVVEAVKKLVEADNFIQLIVSPEE